jgi:hypothetical protein
MSRGTSAAREQSLIEGKDAAASGQSVPSRVRFVAPETPEFCAERGFHGPFCNLERYAAFPGWEGMGECMLCGGSVRAVPAVQLKAS